MWSLSNDYDVPTQREGYLIWRNDRVTDQETVKQCGLLGNYKAFGIARLTASRETKNTDCHPWKPLGSGIIKAFQHQKLDIKS